MPTKLPLVSAICCTFNRPLFVAKAIELFMLQTYPEKELIIVDDGAPGSVPCVPGLPIRHVRLENRAWVTLKHREAFKVASGAFLCYWDDDDWYSRDRLALQAEALSSGAADAVGFHVKALVSVPDARFWQWKRSTLEKWAREAKPGFQAGLPFHDGTAMWRAELLKGLSSEVLGGSQLDLLRTMRSRGARLQELPNDGRFIYVRHSRVGWDFDVQALCEPADCPAWVPPDMLAFWADPRLAGEGAARA